MLRMSQKVGVHHQHQNSWLQPFSFLNSRLNDAEVNYSVFDRWAPLCSCCRLALPALHRGTPHHSVHRPPALGVLRVRAHVLLHLVPESWPPPPLYQSVHDWIRQMAGEANKGIYNTISNSIISKFEIYNKNQSRHLVRYVHFLHKTFWTVHTAALVSECTVKTGNIGQLLNICIGL